MTRIPAGRRLEAMRHRIWSILGAGAVVAAGGCTTDSLDLAGDGSAFLAEPYAPWDLSPESPTPAPSSTPVADFGDGSDGSLSVASDTVLVNDCVRITGVAGSTVEVTDDDAFAPGDRVLLWQTQDAFATEGDAAAVSTSSMELAGMWQLARVTDTDLDELFVDVTPLDFDTALGQGKSAQACRVPEFTDVTVAADGRIEAPAWTPGGGGGIVAFFVSGTLQLDGTISASGRGYLGAFAHQGSNAGQDLELPQTNAMDGGAKGLGLDGQSSGLYGRGNWANAGGGGNAHSAGGGGGGNGGAGGAGGKQWKPDEDAPYTTWGMPGAPIAATYPARLVMGGGGGEGQCHHGGCGDGGDGGGVILVFASSLAGAGDFFSDADDAAVSTNDAGSGGGGGGTIIVTAGSSTFTGLFRANGGDGADAVYDDAGDGANANGDDDTSGPGGGGGGGRVLLFGSDFAMLDPASVSVAGGSNGVNPLAANDPWGAEPGQPGTLDVMQ